MKIKQFERIEQLYDSATDKMIDRFKHIASIEKKVCNVSINFSDFKSFDIGLKEITLNMFWRGDVFEDYKVDRSIFEATDTVITQYFEKKRDADKLKRSEATKLNKQNEIIRRESRLQELKGGA